jgi:uncharacterized cupin superfamily protein
VIRGLTAGEAFRGLRDELELDIRVKTLYDHFFVKKLYHSECAMNQTTVPAIDDVIRIGDLEIRYLNQAVGACRMGCFEMRVAPNGLVPPPHSHPDHEELVYVLEGTLRYRVGARTRDLAPGDSMATPCGEVHSFSNPRAEPVRALVINTPDIGVAYFREIASIMGRDGPPDKSAVVATMRKFGLVPASAPAVGQ